MQRTSSTPRIALLTHEQRPAPTADDQLLADALSGLAQVDVVPWDAPDAIDQLAAADAAVIRSTWNYTETLSSFLEFVDSVRGTATRLLNPAEVVRWNCDKHYLGELERLGVATLPTTFLDRSGVGADPTASESARDTELQELMDRRGWSDVVVKPTVSATARGLFRVERGDAPSAAERFHAARAAHDLMIQPVAPEIERDGEWSLMFFGGEYSHAVRKRAPRGDFRVQSDFGGTSRRETAPAALVDDAARLLELVHQRFAVHAPLLYARVDGIERDGHLVLMELELIEPELFFRSEPAAAAQCARKLLDRF